MPFQPVYAQPQPPAQGSQTAAPRSDLLGAPHNWENFSAVQAWCSQHILAQAVSQDIRYYAVMAHRPGPRNLCGVHASVGLAGYHAITAANGGFGGQLRWRREQTLRLAYDRYMAEGPHLGAPFPIPFFQW